MLIFIGLLIQTQVSVPIQLIIKLQSDGVSWAYYSKAYALPLTGLYPAFGSGYLPYGVTAFPLNTPLIFSEPSAVVDSGRQCNL